MLSVLFRMGIFGPLVMGIADSSFLFVPVGNELLIIVLVARHHDKFLWYSLMGAIGSTLGVTLVDLVARRIGEVGVRKMTGDRRFEYLKERVNRRGGWMVSLASLAPPPFPFTMVIATTSALAYSRVRLLSFVFVCRFLRFLIFSGLAIHYGRGILRMINTTAFRYCAIGFAVLCVVLSVFSIWRWVKSSRKGDRTATAGSSATASA